MGVLVGTYGSSKAMAEVYCFIAASKNASLYPNKAPSSSEAYTDSCESGCEKDAARSDRSIRNLFGLSTLLAPFVHFLFNFLQLI